MKKNKGFSIVELVVSFSLTMVIVIILFEIIVAMKNLYVNSVTKTELLNKQNLFTDYIYSDIYNYGLEVVSLCGNNCISFTFDDGNTKNLEWSFYSGDDGSQAVPALSYGDYKVNLITNASFDTSLKLTDGYTMLEGVKICDKVSYFEIKLPVHHSIFKDEDFGIDILYVHDGTVDLNLPSSIGC